MTMTIDEKYNNAIQMFRSYYDGKNETLRIKSSVLRENGFGEDFWSMLCPRLQREGILKEWPSFFHGISGEEVMNQEKYKQLTHKWEIALSMGKLAEKEELEKEMGFLERIHTFVVDGEKLLVACKKQQVTDSASGQSDQSKKTWQKNKLNFYPDSGSMEFGGEMGNAKSGNKDYALLTLLHGSKNTPFSIDDIQEKCNPLVVNPAHKFKGEKDISDTVRQIRYKLKVDKGVFFPISKTMRTGHKSWVLIDK
jgi:hypothetical protein